MTAHAKHNGSESQAAGTFHSRAAHRVSPVFGLIDYSAIPANTRAKHIGRMHGIGNVAVVLLFS
jgi:hypothetical protein